MHSSGLVLEFDKNPIRQQDKLALLMLFMRKAAKKKNSEEDGNTFFLTFVNEGHQAPLFVLHQPFINIS